MSEQKIEQVNISEIKPYPKNAKKHTQGQIKQIAKSIKEFGFNQPLVLDKDNTLIVGHGRYLGALELGLKKVPAIKLANLTDEQVKAYRLADNKLNESQWDQGLVIEELKELNLKGFDISLTGFDADLILPVEEDGFDAEREYAKIGEAKTKLGDMYQLGSHRLLCGDSTKPEDVKRVMDGELADMIFTDPPYNVNYNYAVKYQKIHKARKKMFLDGGKIFNDNKSNADFEVFLLKVLKNCYDFSKKEMAIYVCHATKTQEQFFDAFKKAGFHFSQTIIWLKERIILALGQDYHRIYEPIMFGWKKGEKHWKNKNITTEKEVWDLDKMSFEERLDVWYLARDKSSEYEHPTQKPVRLPERAIKKNCPQGGALLEPFGGSGSTLLAAEQMKRRCFTIELDPKYTDIIIGRWERYTGLKAKKLN